MPSGPFGIAFFINDIGDLCVQATCRVAGCAFATQAWMLKQPWPLGQDEGTHNMWASGGLLNEVYDHLVLQHEGART